MKYEAQTSRNKKGQFESGKSGNPAGRPIGSRNKSKLVVESLLEAESERLTRKAIEMATKGDHHALRLCIERLLPPRKDRLIDLSLPPVESVEQLASATSAVVQAIGDGQITPAEGQALANILAIQCDVVCARDLYHRVEALEQAIPTEKTTSATMAAEAEAVNEKIVETLNRGRKRNAEKAAPPREEQTDEVA